MVISKQEKVNIKSVYFDAEYGIFEGTIMLYVNNTNQLDKLKEKCMELKISSDGSKNQLIEKILSQQSS